MVSDSSDVTRSTLISRSSEILEELPLPQSDLLRYHELVPHPNAEVAEGWGFPSHVIESYLAHLYVRKQLNWIYSLLYDPTGNKARDKFHFDLLTINHTIKPFQADEPPPGDILSASFRAKYWDSQVLLYRPFLRIILEGQAVPNQDIIAHQAIQALIKSTEAFHGMDSSQRIIVTNVFGIAHAYVRSHLQRVIHFLGLLTIGRSRWGHLLMLAACYRNETLREFISQETLCILFKRTISFFQMIAHRDSALLTDMNILISLARELGFMLGDDEMTPGTGTTLRVADT